MFHSDFNRKCSVCGSQAGPTKRTKMSPREQPQTDPFQLPDFSADDSAFLSANEAGGLHKTGVNNHATEDTTTFSELAELRATSDVDDLISLDARSEDNWLSQETFRSSEL